MGVQTRQSKDFQEIWNVQTSMEVKQEKWDKIFHNYKEPWNCSGNKKATGCSICDRIKKTGKDDNEKSFILTILGDIHTNLNAVNTILTPPNYLAISVGDISIYPDMASALLDKKSFQKNEQNIKTIIDGYDNKTLLKLSTKVYSILGNHDNFIDLDNDIFRHLNIEYLKNGTLLEIGNLVIATLGGIYSPKKFYWDDSKLLEYNKRFFTKTDIYNLIEKAKTKKIDILITHQAAMGVLPAMKSNVDEGSAELATLLDAIKPTYYIHGHHHISYESNKDGINIIGLGNIKNDPTAFVRFNILTKNLI